MFPTQVNLWQRIADAYVFEKNLAAIVILLSSLKILGFLQLFQRVQILLTVCDHLTIDNRLNKTNPFPSRISNAPGHTENGVRAGIFWWHFVRSAVFFRRGQLFS